jgi:organic radical activating enzyme
MLSIARLNSAPEIFYSLQGEGTRCGTPAVFLRLAGCNLKCKWCDTKHSWGSGITRTAAETAAEITAFACNSLVITGGEPLLQQAALEELLLHLPDDMHIEVETNGTILPTSRLAQRINQWNVSPKLLHSGNAQCTALPAEPLAFFAAQQNAWFKFVVQAEEDWAAIVPLRLPRHRIILMPCATTRAGLEAARPAVVDMCLRHGVRLGDRLHLSLWDDKKGV